LFWLQRWEEAMNSLKLIVALVAAAVISMLTAITPATAQKDPACIEKCNRDNPGEASGPGSTKTRGTAQRIRACIAACPKAKTTGKT
jgi:hypothetical protein